MAIFDKFLETLSYSLSHYFIPYSIVVTEKKAMSHYQVVARKYRPQRFSDVLGQDPIVKTLKNALKSGKSAHAYLFCGSRGTGKTTLARILAKALNCTNLTEECEPCNSCPSCKEITHGSSLDVLEIDGASHRGIDDIKQISESVGYCPTGGKYKIYLIDEVHMLTKEAFNALLKTLEEPPANVKFFFATTEAHKIPPTILSRCQRFNLARIPRDAMVQKLKNIAADMHVEVDDKALIRLTDFAEGGLRDAESLFDQMVACGDSKITEDVVHDVLGVMPKEQFFLLDRAVLEQDIKVAFSLANELFSQGKEVSHFLEDLNQHYKNILFTKLGTPHADSSYKMSAEIYTQDQILLIFDMIQETVSMLKSTTASHMVLEGLLLRIVRIRQKISIEAIARRLVQLEEKISGQKAPPQPMPPQPQAAPIAIKVEPKEPPKAPVTTAPPVLADDVQKNARYDTLTQFAAVELEGTVQRKRRK